MKTNHSRIIYLDIETVPGKNATNFAPAPADIKYGNIKDQSKKDAKYAEVCEAFLATSALHAETAEIVLIGYAVDGGNVIQLHGDECEMLVDFFDLLIESPHTIIVGHNVVGFDLRMMFRRALIHYLPLPKFFSHAIRQYRTEAIIDTADLWAMGDRNTYISLAKLCKIFGIEVKEGPVTGADFYKWWAKDKQLCMDYNRQDVEATRKLFYAMGGE